MAKTKNIEIDVRKQGPLSYKLLQNVNNADFTNEDELQALEEYRKSLYSRKSTYSPYEHMDLYVVSPVGRTKNSWGESKWDNDTASEEEFSRLSDVRADNQGFFSEVGNGLAKGAILAGTTFLDGTVGLLVGLGTAIAENRFSGIYDNAVSNALKSVNDWAEEALPNYYSEAELAGPWYNNVFSGNFLGDKFIKNLGFTVGAFYSGGLYAKGAQALVRGAASLAKKTGASIKAVKGILNSGSTTAALVGSGISALNEGRIEALNNSEDWFNYNKLLYTDDYINTLNALGLDYGVDENGDIILKGPINPRALLFQDNYNLTLAKLAEDRAKMGNHDLLFNIPILMASNVFLFGKLYTGGYKTARRATNIVKRAGGYETAKTTTKGVLKSMTVPLAEGMEEISQKAASEVSGNYYSTDVNNFYKAKMDPNAEQQTLSWINSAAEGIAKTVSEGSSWEEFFIGYLTGALGMPGFRSFKNSENKFQSPVYLLGGAYGTFKEYSELMRRELELAEYLNKRVQDPKFVNYYQGLIRHNKFQNDMNMAAEEGNAFEYKNAEHNQLLSDIIMFDNAGKLQDLNDMIVEAFNTSDENLEDIINNTTSTTKNPDGSEVKVGPYIDKSGNPATGTEKSKQEMIESITKRKDEMLSLIEDYRKTKEEIDIDYNEVFSNELLEELAWLKLQGQNWKERATELAKEIKPTITKLRSALYNELRTISMQKTEEGKRGIAPSKDYKDLDLYERELNSSILTLLQLEALEDLHLAVFLTAAEGLSENIQQVLEDLQKQGDNAIEDSEYTDFVSKTSDIKKLILGYNKFNLKLKEYRENPEKISEQQELVKEETAKQDLEQKTSDLKLKLLSSKNVFDFRSILEQEEDEGIKNSTLESLQKENNVIAKHYKDLQQYKSAVYKALNDSKKDAKTIENALKLFENHFNNSSNLQEIDNFNSVHINDPQHILDNTKTEKENLHNFTEALWTLMQAMNKVNNDNAFKDSFSKEYKELKQQGVPVTNTPSKDTTGDSGTATIPPVNNGGGPVTAPVEEGPVGSVSKQLIIDENKDLNNTTQDQKLVDDLHKGLKPYYRPAIPELHINAVKNGDFRPFNVVVFEKENLNFDIIYNYLKDSGSFSYVNEGNLKEGDSLLFMIDPQFEESVKDQPWHKEPTVFIVHKTKEGNYQVVGSLDESEYSVKKYAGLSELLNKVRTEYELRNNTNDSKPLSFTTDYLYDKEMSAYGITGTLSRIENGTAIYVDSNNNPVILLAAKADHLFVGIFKEADSDKWSIKMENKEGNKEDFKNMISSAMGVLPSGAKIYERTSISLDGLRVFAQQLNHGFSIQSEQYETNINGGDIANTFGVSKEASENMNLIEVTPEELPKIKDILKPYLEKLGITNIDESVFITNGNQVSIKLPIITKTGNIESGENTSNKNKFIASPKTKVSQIMVGKIPYTNEEKNLQQIPNVSKNGNQPIFGIMKNGSLVTNKEKDIEVVGFTDVSNKEGRLYLLLPNAAGKYSPIAVRVKHFNETEFDLNDIAVANTPIGKSISEAIITLAESLSQEDVSDAVKSLEQDIYFRDVMVTWFSANAGDGIVISKKARKPDGSYEKIMISGKEYIKEDKYTIYFTNKKSAEINGIVYDASALEKLGQTDIAGEPKDPAVILKEILSVITEFNLPLQVSTGKINNGNYNKIILNSNILTSNISNAEVLGSWFTTDYFDSEGNLKKADTIKAPILNTGNSPVGGKESYKGIPITIGADTVYVDLSKNLITDSFGTSRPITPSDILLQDLAWAQNAYGNVLYSERMIDGKIITPTNRVLDRKTLKYLSDEEAQIIINKINSANSRRQNSESIISKIYENLSNVDKSATDSEYYYIKEEDGKYHEYSRVHTKIGSNSLESDKLLKALQDIQIKLSTNADNINQYNSYLDNLSSYYGVNLNEYKGKTGITDRKAIVEIIRNSMISQSSKNALSAGSSVDTVIRLFFTDKSLLKLPENMSYDAYVNLLASLEELKSGLDARGERFLTNNIVLYNKYLNGERIAGEVDILAVDKNGNFKIYDVKTSKYSFHDFNSNGMTVNYFKNKAKWQNMSTEAYYTKQLSVYKELFEYQYNTPIVTLAILPFVLQSNLGVVNNITRERGIMINYTPVLSTQKTTTTVTPTTVQSTDLTSDNLPIFNSTLETSNPQNRVLPGFNMKNSKVGYYRVGNTIYKGYLHYIGNVDNVPIHITKITTVQHNNDEDNTKDYEYYEYLVVFPNGNTFSIFQNTARNEELVAGEILEALNKNITRVHEESSKNGLPVTTLSVTEKPTTGGASVMVKVELSIKDNNDEFEPELDLTSYRKLDSDLYTVFDKQKELQWLNEVLPQLSELDRIRFVEGLIQVGNSGTAAWGKFEKGIVTLSNIAAEGTTYHEAFHVVFNLMLNESERENLLELARKMYGNKSLRDLEEDLAEGFREYVMTREEKGILNKIKNFFKSLFIKVKYWSSFKPHIYSYYKNINKGKYSNKALSENIVKALYSQELYTQEMQEIKDKAIANGTFMKAPNGNPTNLTTERQWIHVRTKAFKEWFGDWEVAAYYNSIEKAVTNETLLSEFVKYFDSSIANKNNEKYTQKLNHKHLSILADLIRTIDKTNENKIKVKFYDESKFKAGYGFISQDNGDIYLPDRGTKGLTDKDIQTFIHEFAHHITLDSYFKNVKFRREIALIRQTLINYIKERGLNDRLIEYAFKNDIEFIAEAFSNSSFQQLLKDCPSKNKIKKQSLWSNFIQAIKKVVNERWGGGIKEYNTLLDDVFALIEDNVSNYTGSHYIDNVSKVVDENGEPLVVYHHTNNADLSEFSTDFDNYFAKDGGTKEAIFFDEEKTRTLNRKYDKAFFLNIRDLNEYNETKKLLHDRGTTYREIVNQSAEKNNIDRGVHMKNFDDNKKENQSIWIIHNPNQAKSATDNIGTYSRENNDTRYRKASYSFNTLPQEVQQALIKKGWNQELFDSISEREKEIAVTCAGL